MAEEKTVYPIVVPLQYPIEYGSELISELKLRRAKGKEYRMFQSGEPSMDDMLNLLGKLSGQPPSVIDELDGDDLGPLFEALGKCLPSSRKTSRTR